MVRSDRGFPVSSVGVGIFLVCVCGGGGGRNYVVVIL